MKLHRMLLLSAVIGAMGAPAMADPPSNLQVFTSSDSFTVPSGVTTIEVEVRGGGGGAGGSVSYPGQGGCGGGYGKSVFAVTPGSTHTVTVGAGGAGGGSASGTGAAGGASSFGTFISATGGGGGLRNGAAGCAGGTSTAALNRTGAVGEQNGGIVVVSTVYVVNNRGGLCGDGSTRGSGGRGRSQTGGIAGSPGAAGNVVVRW
jgi:hypothetical protein